MGRPKGFDEQLEAAFLAGWRRGYYVASPDPGEEPPPAFDRWRAQLGDPK